MTAQFARNLRSEHTVPTRRDHPRTPDPIPRRVDVAPAATARVRQLSRGGRRKNDRIDAAAAASVAAMHGDARPVRPETHAASLALLNDRRKTLSEKRTRSVNQLHALLRELLPGGVPTDLTAAKATIVLRGMRPISGTDRVQKLLAKDLVADIKRADIKRYEAQLAENVAAMSDLLDQHGSDALLTTVRSACCWSPPLPRSPIEPQPPAPDSGTTQPTGSTSWLAATR
ncbi:IS110 family transposase [Nocardia sp. NPDC004278]